MAAAQDIARDLAGYGAATPPKVLRALVDAAGERLAAALAELWGQGAAEWYLGGKDAAMAMVIAAEPAVRVAAYRAAGSRVTADLGLAKDLAGLLDPLIELRVVVGSAQEGARKVESIGAWARKYGPETCRRALADGQLHVALGKQLGAGRAAEATALLIGAGTIPDTPAARLDQAMYRKDPGAFASAWAELEAADPAGAERRLADATFFVDVQQFVPEAYPDLLARLTRDPVVAPPPALAELAAPVVARITSAVVATGGLDIPFGDPSVADPALAAAAEQVYAYRRSAIEYAGVEPAAELPVERQALEVLRGALSMSTLCSYGTAAGREPLLRALDTGDHELGKRQARDDGRTALTAAELAQVDAVADGYAGRLAAVDDDDAATALLIQFEREAGGALGSTGADRTSQWVDSERRRQTLDRLDRAFVARTGRPLRGWLDGLGAWGTTAADTLAGLRAERDLEDDPSAYGEALTSLELKRLATRFEPAAERLGPLVRRAGSTWRLDGELPDGLVVVDWQSMRLGLDRGFTDRALAALQAEVREVVAPKGPPTGPTLAAWERKVGHAMAAFEQQISSRFGSLRRALDAGAGGGSDRDASLVRLGLREDPSAKGRLGALEQVSGDARDASAFLDQFGAFVAGLAADLGDVFAPAFAAPPPPMVPRDWTPTIDQQVSDDDVLGHARAFARWADAYPQRVPGSARSDATRALTAAFAPIGGGLPRLVAEACGEEAAGQALSLFGLTARGVGGPRPEELAAVEAQLGGAAAAPARAETVGAFDERVEARAAEFSHALANLPAPDALPRPMVVAGLAARARTLVGLARLGKYADARLQQLWFDQLGIALPDDLGQHLVGAERATFAALFGLPESSLSA
ncbi:MAG: hypothetical protein ABMA64_39165, partial [Myxococcota bacterium]